MTREEELKHYGILGMHWGRRLRNKDGSLTPHGIKKENKQVGKEIKKRSSDIFIKSNNDAALKINNGWIDKFNDDWAPKFKKHDDDWSKSPHFESYIKAYTNNLVDLMNESARKNPNAIFKTKTGSEYVASFMKENANITWNKL
jgi:hypothetical protein